MTARHDPGAATVEELYDEVSYDCSSSVYSTTRYYRAFGRIIATRTTTSSASDVRYYVADHLGSTNTILTSSGSVYVGGMKYWPFGAQRAGGTPDHGYTGQLRDDYSTIGAYYYHARFYSTTLAHFTSPDTTTADGLNRYAYTRANPTRYMDPSGHCVLGLPCLEEQLLGALRCSFLGWCPTAAPVEDMLRFTRWAIRQPDFYRWVITYASFDAGFKSQVIGIRAWLPSTIVEDKLYVNETGLSFASGSPDSSDPRSPENKGFGRGPGLVQITRSTKTLTLLAFDVSYSYLDIAVVPYGTKPNNTLFAWSISVDGNTPVDMGPQWLDNGKPHGRYEVSLFDHADHEILLSFYGTSTEFVGRIVTLYSSDHTYSPIYTVSPKAVCCE